MPACRTVLPVIGVTSMSLALTSTRSKIGRSLPAVPAVEFQGGPVTAPGPTTATYSLAVGDVPIPLHRAT